jgi:hypothetical protein
MRSLTATAMSVWLSYRDIEADDGAAAGGTGEFQYIKAGALINF